MAEKIQEPQLFLTVITTGMIKRIIANDERELLLQPLKLHTRHHCGTTPPLPFLQVS